MNYLQRLEETDNLLCLGLDPVPSRMPEGFEGVDGAERFLTILLLSLIHISEPTRPY